MSQQTPDRTAEASAPAGAPRWGGLLRSEIRRARSRRSLWRMSSLALLGIVAISAILFATTAAVDQGDLDAAADRAFAEQQGWYQECLNDSTIPEAEREKSCYLPTEADSRRDAIYWVSPSPSATTA